MNRGRNGKCDVEGVSGCECEGQGQIEMVLLAAEHLTRRFEREKVLYDPESRDFLLTVSKKGQPWRPEEAATEEPLENTKPAD